MIVVTGGAGFIGSAVVWKLNALGQGDVLVVDALGSGEKWRNLPGLRYNEYRHKDDFRRSLAQGGNPMRVEAVVHMGACSATTERDADYLHDNNTRYSLELCRWCLENGVRFVNASSAATYGDGSQGFQDGSEGLERLRPMNMYGYSKHLFDLAAKREGWLDSVASLKFFNVYGPNEYHKGEMRSVACKAFEQISAGGPVRLFRSHREGWEDGGQLRDFVYVKDCAEVVCWLLTHPEVGGIFNVGTGKARSFRDLALAVYAAMGEKPRIEYVDMPEAIRDTYQYFTEAPMDRLREAGYHAPFTSLEDGVGDYVRGYLAGGSPWL
ncbi:ADP-glyceromanno-heptose 6-epimerase [Fundidesulfovibrio agrisoli]|uniref:ADP-glyceromanno-heptose 6-epimerase n=1 Tax=Fundidesulfovibrio agrisoli TaxID=2922717 RepID=UPI001FAC28F2|nr:ADP-glyceromanno-heptose 6-epimerase [Fundidesulfovibrio agrisoli]